MKVVCPCTCSPWGCHDCVAGYPPWSGKKRPNKDNPDLESRIAALEQTVAELRQEVARMKAKQREF